MQLSSGKWSDVKHKFGVAVLEDTRTYVLSYASGQKKRSSNFPFTLNDDANCVPHRVSASKCVKFPINCIKHLFLLSYVYSSECYLALWSTLCNIWHAWGISPLFSSFFFLCSWHQTITPLCPGEGGRKEKKSITPPARMVGSGGRGCWGRRPFSQVESYVVFDKYIFYINTWYLKNKLIQYKKSN